MIDFEALAQPGIRGLRAYDPGHDLVALRRRFNAPLPVELGSNENPYGPSSAAIAAIQATLSQVHIYPDPLGGELKKALAAKHGVDVSQILLGNGSHELLMQMAQVFAGPGTDVVASRYGFAVYALAAQAAGARLVLAEAFTREHAMPLGHDLKAIAAATGPNTRLIYLANPNNPTGTWFSSADLQALLAGVPEQVLVVVDEAYAEFLQAAGADSALSLLARHPNLIVTRTFSKAYALAGLRVGYAVADAALVAVMERVRESFNVNALALAAAVAALQDDDHLSTTLAANAVEREALADVLRQRGCFVYPSQTNFLLVEFPAQPVTAVELERQLVANGIVLRPMIGYGLADCLRITVGTHAENARLLQALDTITKGQAA